jgi:hypothetical protein
MGDSFVFEDAVDDKQSLTEVYHEMCTHKSPHNQTKRRSDLPLVSEGEANDGESPPYYEAEEDIPLYNQGSFTLDTEYDEQENPYALASLSIDILGSSSNIVVILVILPNKRLHKPFYMSIMSLCISDFLYFANDLVNNNMPFEELCSTLRKRMIFDVTSYSVKMFSKLNVVLLACVRYVMFVYPLKSRMHLTNRLILKISSTAMVLSMAYGVAMRFLVWSIPTSRARVLYIVDDGILLMTVVILNGAFFIHRLRVAKTSQAARDLKLQMTIVVMVILVLHTISSLFAVVANFSKYSVLTLDMLKDSKPMSAVSKLGYTVSKLAHLIHPFLFFFSSPFIIKSIASLLSKCKLTN